MVSLEGWQVAGFYTTLYDHVLTTCWAVLAQPATHTPEPLTRALAQLADITSSLFHQINPPHSVAA